MVMTRKTKSELYQKRQAGSEWGQEGFTPFVWSIGQGLRCSVCFTDSVRLSTLAFYFF